MVAVGPTIHQYHKDKPDVHQATYVVTGDGGPSRLDRDEVVEFARTVLYGPNRASGESAFGS